MVLPGPANRAASTGNVYRGPLLFLLSNSQETDLSDVDEAVLF